MKRWLVLVSLMSVQIICTTDAGQLELQVYTQTPTIDEFLYQKDLPEMTENTICMWINLGADDDGYSEDYLFSISEPNEDNVYTIRFGTSLLVYVNGLVVNLSQITADVLHLFLGWHKHCLTFKSGETFKWYTETNITGEMELLESVSVPSFTMPAGGALILMQEQDSFFGDLNLNQATYGKIAWFNMWDYAMTVNEIQQLRCRDEGNVVTWDTLSQQGSDHMHFESFDCKDEAPAATCSLDVYTQTRTTSNYLYNDRLPAMSEYTICFWITSDSSNVTNRYKDFLLSISTPEHSDELKVGWKDDHSLQVYSRNDSEYLNYNNPTENDLLFVGWHKHCFTYCNNTFGWYADRTNPTELELIRFVTLNATLGDSGYLILMQEQDAFGGGVDSADTAPSQYTWFNMWNYKMAFNRLKQLSCTDKGNVVSWDNMQEFGSVTRTYETFFDMAIKPELNTLEKKYIDIRKQQMTFCKISGASLISESNLYSQTVSSAARCVLLCTKEESCWSANFQRSTGTCTVNSDIDQGNEADFVTGLGNDFLHFTARECVD